MKKLTYLASFFALISLSGCENYFGDKTDISFIDIPEYSSRIAAYVPIQPIVDDLIYPTDVSAGFDELVYVVDNGTEEIIAYDQSVKELGRFSVPGVTSVAQDRSLNLLAIGTTDTIINGLTLELTCIYRISMESSSGAYGIRHAKITKKITHPFYFKNTFSSSDQFVVFNNIAVLADNKYYISRNGDNNDQNKLGGPDDAVLLFDENDNYITPIIVTTSEGFYNNYFKKPSGIVSLVQPPQNTTVTSEDFMYTSIDMSPDNSYRYKYIAYNESENGSEYVPENLTDEDYSKADGFITEANKFLRPMDIALSGDNRNYIFIVDAVKDSVFQFTFNGIEGVKPPADSEESKYINVSFGGTGVGPTQFNDPQGVAFLNEILYVADTGNGRLLRFKLTLDID